MDAILKAKTYIQCSNARFAYTRAASKLQDRDVDRLIGMFPGGSDDEHRIATFWRSRMLMALAYAPKGIETIPFLEPLLWHGSYLTQIFAVTTLGIMGPNAKASAKSISTLADGGYNPSLSYVALNALRKIDPSKAATNSLARWLREYGVRDWCVVSPAEPQPEPPRGLAVAIENYVAQVAGLAGNAATFGEHLVQKIGQTEPADLTDAVVDRLTKARQDLWDVLQRLDEYLEQVEQRRRLAIQPQDDWEGPAADQPQDRTCEEHQEQIEEVLVDAM